MGELHFGGKKFQLHERDEQLEQELREAAMLCYRAYGLHHDFGYFYPTEQREQEWRDAIKEAGAVLDSIRQRLSIPRMNKPR